MGLEIIGLLNVLLALGFILHGFAYINITGKDSVDRALFGTIIILLSLGFFVSGINIMAGALTTTEYLSGSLILTTVGIKLGKIAIIWIGVTRLFKKYRKAR